MAELDISLAPQVRPGRDTGLWLEPLLGLGVGLVGGGFQSFLLSTSLMDGIAYGAPFGVPNESRAGTWLPAEETINRT
jgi:hypothetical protein